MKFIGTKRLETERLYLRRLTVDDAKEAFENWCQDKDVCKYVTWDIHESLENTKALYNLWEKEYEQPDTFRWFVVTKENNEPIGTIDVVSKKYLPYGTCEIGYCYKKSSWGKGYGTEALKRVIKFLFEECDADVIFAEYMTNNPGSGKVMAKSGMKYEGAVRGRILDKDGNRNDLGSYSITKAEYFDESNHLQ